MKTVITVPLIHKVPACKIRTNLIYWRNSASTRKYVLVWNTENIIVVYFQLWKWFSTRFLWLKLLTFHFEKRKYIKNKCYAKFTYCLLSVKQHSHVNANWSFMFKYPYTPWTISLRSFMIYKWILLLDYVQMKECNDIKRLYSAEELYPSWQDGEFGRNNQFILSSWKCII